MKADPREIAPVENKPFVVIVLALILLIGVALWQFYSLAWGDVLPDRRPAGHLATTPH
ncbi:MAG TPA: hypothetical protein VEC60_03575 [Reyranella sp.]|nr:hypothetical protein [Reyranella sp.]